MTSLNIAPLKVAVVGAGNLGRIHTRLMLQQNGVELVAVAESCPAARQRIADEFSLPAVEHYESILSQIDAAVIATPTHTHFDVASDLIKRGIHVLIEKPLTDSVTTARRLVDLAARHRSVVQVGHVERFNPVLKEALSHVGKPRLVTANRLSGYTFRSTDIGVVHDLMIHDIDLVNSMFGSDLFESRAIGMSIFGEHEDMAQARLQFRCGGVANLSASRCSYQNERTMQIYGTDGFAAIDFTSSTVTCVQIPDWIRDRKYNLLDTPPEQQAYIRDHLFEKVLRKQEIAVDKSNAILDEQRDWLHAIKYRETPRVPIEQGSRAVEVAQSVLDSLNAHRWLQTEPATTGPLCAVSKIKDPVPQWTRKAA